MRQNIAVAAVAVGITFVLLGLGQGPFPEVRLHAQQAGSIAPPRREARSLDAQSAAIPAPKTAATAFMDSRQALSPSQLASSRLDFDRLSVTWQGRRAGVITADPAAGPPAGSEVVLHESPAEGSDAAGSLVSRVMPLSPNAFGLAVRMVAEPALAVGDSAWWLTGNWFAARSTDEGATWTYANPYADFATFASDQDAVYDPHRRLFLWYRQGGLLPGRLENSLRLSVSSDAAASWCTYSLRPSEVDPSWNTASFDYPHLALSDNHLYVSSMLVEAGGGFASPRMVLFRLPLNELGECSAFRFNYWTTDEGWSWTPVENGATTAMFLGDTLDPGGNRATGTFRLYVQPENTTALYYFDREVPAWTFTERTGFCPVLGGGNPCGRSDGRITSGWVRRQNGRGEIGFLWNVREGGGFPHPYINAVTFDEETLSVTGRPMLWDVKCAWQYGAAAPNGDSVGIAAFHFCSSQPPAHAVGVAAASGGQARWTMTYSRIGTVATSTVIWGDYIRARASGSGYLATGYTIGEIGAEPFVVRFVSARPGRFDEEIQPPLHNPRN